jgi:hypothetical protein
MDMCERHNTRQPRYTADDAVIGRANTAELPSNSLVDWLAVRISEVASLVAD